MDEVMTDLQDISDHSRSQTPGYEHPSIRQLDEIKDELQNLHERIGKLPQDVVKLLGADSAVPNKLATQSVVKDVGCLELELVSAKEQIAQLVAALDTKQAELQDARQQISKIQGNEVKLRTIILQKKGVDKISDQEVKDRFVLIRQKAQSVAHSSTFQTSAMPKKVKGLTKEAHDFYNEKNWSQWTPKDRKNHVMAKIFEILYERIFDFKMFSPFIVHYTDREEVEPGLRRFENFLEKNNIDTNLLANWRATTMDCMSQLQAVTQMTHRNKHIADDIFSFFLPILAEDVSVRREDELQSQILDLCTEAIALAIIMRGSKEGYECNILPTRDKRCTMDQYEKQVEPLSVEGGKNDRASNEIAYITFGGLVKHVDQIPKVLEKAQIILKRR